MIIFTGVAGSGKSVQGKLLADAQNYPWLSTGEFLRMLIAGEPRQRMLDGKLLRDDEIIAIVKKVFSLIDAQEEFVLDGFPRTIHQADWLIEYVQAHDTQVSLVVHMVASKATVRERLLERGRPDDHRAAIDERFDEYERSIKPILKLFASNNIPVAEINAERSVQDVHQEVLAAVRAHVSNS